MVLTALLERGRFDGYGSLYSTSYFVFRDGDDFVLNKLAGAPPQSWYGTMSMRCGYHIDRSVWTLDLSVTATPGADGAPGPPALTDEFCRKLIAERPAPRIDVPSRVPAFARLDAQQWFDANFAEMLATGETTRTTRPSIRVRAYLAALTACLWLPIPGAALSILSWYLRGVQIAYHTRALHRHESGRCPNCNYDISAAPDHPCPECGTDHRAARREAIRALQRAKRWPLDNPLPKPP
jgi:predicted RNA-binding Zn-ribbon protein involved in translation (DUF1610 family)